MKSDTDSHVCSSSGKVSDDDADTEQTGLSVSLWVTDLSNQPALLHAVAAGCDRL